MLHVWALSDIFITFRKVKQNTALQCETLENLEKFLT